MTEERVSGLSFPGKYKASGAASERGSGGADLMKMGLERIEDAGLADTVRLVIHDEVLLSVPPGPEGAAQAETVRQCMESEFRGVKFEAHASGPGNSWGDVA